MTRAMHKAAAKRYEADADDAHKEGKTHKRDWANNMAKNHNQAAKEMESVKEEEFRIKLPHSDNLFYYSSRIVHLARWKSRSHHNDHHSIRRNN